MRPLLWLDEIGEADRPAVGAKAFTLARLRRQGFPVPDGFVVTAGARPPADELRAAWARLAAPVAVRSSSTAEDSAEASFAGQHRTVLDVRSADQLEEAVALCLRSTDGARPYSRAMGAAPGSMAVLVQRLVEPRVAGVAFTRHPADPSRLLVEAHRGRGEELVSGAISPERYVVDRETGSLQDGPRHGSLDGTALAAVFALASHIETVLGAPQDVEWALGADGIALLQSRPITVEDEDVPDPRVRRLTRANVGEVLPDPVTPLTWTTVGAFLERAFREVAARAGLLSRDPAPFLVLHRRRLYLNLDACLEVAARVPVLSATDAERLLLGGGARGHASLQLTASSLARLARVAWRLLRLGTRLPGEIESAERRVRALAPRTEIDAADAGRLRSLLLRFVAVGHAVAETHVATSGASAFRLAFLARVLSLAPGDPTDRGNRLLAVLDNVESAAPALTLEVLARKVREEPEWIGWLWRREPGAPATTSDAPPALRSALLAFLERFGHRAFSEGELAAPAWEDDPAPVLDALRTLANASPSPGLSRRAAAALREADEEALLSRLGPLRRALVRRVLAGARAGVRQREHTKSLAVALARHGRRLARASARLLATKGTLPREEDVFFLRLEELLGALEHGRPLPAALLRRRRKRHEGEGALPAPREVDLAGKDARHGEDRPGLRGIGVSPGVGLGPARVLRYGEVPRLDAGEVLVTPVLDAGFAPLLVSAAGAVAEIGGLLSHGAVVARELGVPCVVDVPDATRRISPGERVLVDGRRGEVRLAATEARGSGALASPPLLEWEDPGSERLLPLEPHPLARESVYLNVHDPAAGLVIVATLGIRRRGRGESLLAMGLPDGRVLFGLDLAPAGAEGSRLSVAGTRTEWNPARLHVETRLAGYDAGEFPPGPLPLLLAPRTVPVSMDLVFVPTTPPIDFGRQLSEGEREALRPLGSYHVEQSGAWRGEVVVEGRRIALAGTGSRDHSRGRRDWEAADHWRLFTARLGDDLAVHALAVSVRGTLVEGGFLWREGRTERVTRVLHSATREGGRVRSLELEVATAAGPALRLSGRVERTIVVPVQVERRPGRHLAGRPYRLLLHENFTRYEGGGRVGYGIAEITERPL